MQPFTPRAVSFSINIFCNQLYIRYPTYTLEHWGFKYKNFRLTLSSLYMGDPYKHRRSHKLYKT